MTVAQVYKGVTVEQVYRGVTVAVHKVDKAEISLTRQDLVELINVRSLSLKSRSIDE